MTAQYRYLGPYHCGIPVKTSTYLTETITRQRKTHRKKRINKKWRKRYGVEMIETPSPKVIHITIPGKECFLMHPAVFEEFKRQVDAAQDKAFDHAMDQASQLIYGGSRSEKDWRNSCFRMEDFTNAYGQITRKDFV